MTSRLPIPGQDDNVWGAILNDFLSVEHNTDGTLKKAADIAQAKADAAQALTTAQQAASATIADNSVTKAKLATTVQTSLDKADTALQTAPVTSVAGKTGIVNLGYGDIMGTPVLATVATSGSYTDLEDKPNFPLATTYNVDTFGADPTGATSSDTAVAAARTALGSNVGTIEFGPGTYLLTTPVSQLQQGQNVIGAGRGATLINFTGTGVVFEAHDTRAWGSGGPGPGGIFAGFTIDGTGAGPSSAGMRLGDMTGIKIDNVRIQNFTGAGSVGMWFYNTTTWAERLDVSMYVTNCTTGMLFERGAGYPSFDYSKFFISVSASANQDGVVFKNGVDLLGCNFYMVGNYQTGTANTGSVMIFGANGASDSSALRYSQIEIMVETGGATGVGHKTFNFGNSAVMQGHGVLKFTAGNGVPFVAGNAKLHTAFSGIIDVDSNLGRMSYWQGHRTVGLQTGSYVSIGTGTTVLYMSSQGNMLAGQLAVGNTTYTIDTDIAAKASTGETGVWDIFLRQPSSGGNGTVTWPTAFTWLTGSAPTLSTTANAYDHIRVTTRDFVTFFAEHVNRTIGSGIARSIVPVSSAVTLGSSANTDYIALVSSGGAPTLPSAVGNTNVYTVKNRHTTGITISTTSAQTIQGSATYTLAADQTVRLLSDGTNWVIL